MKTFILKSGHAIYEDSYEQGEGKYVNCYDMESEITSEDASSAIKEYFKNHLHLNYDEDFRQVDEENSNVLFYSNLVDLDGYEVSEKDCLYEDWKNGNAKLYSNNTWLKIYELVEINLNF